MTNANTTTKCKECDSDDIEWHCSEVNRSSVVDGRLMLSEVSTEFFLGCNYCSETLEVISGVRVAELMNKGLIK